MAKKTKISEHRGIRSKELKELAKKAEERQEKKMKAMQLEDILTEEQLSLYNLATPQRKLWLEWFVRTGDSTVASKKAYPRAKPPSARTISYLNRQHFKINTAMLFRALGIDENIIHERIQTLMFAKRLKRSFIKGDMTEEIEEEDTYAIDRGISHAMKMTGNDNQKLLLGEDPENKFNSLADALLTVLNGKPVPQKAETPPNPKP